MPAAEAVKWVQIDLGSSVVIDKVWLVPARPVDFPDTPGFGFPLRFKVEIADDSEMKTSRLLLDRTSADFPSPGDAPLELAAGGASGRYVRVTATRLWKRLDDYVFALAELQVLEGGRNLALGMPVAALDSIEAGLWSRRHLVDGYSSRKRLESTASPAGEESKRKELEAEVVKLTAERAAVIDARLDPEVRRERDEVKARLEALRRDLAALPPPRAVYAAASVFKSDGSFTAAGKPRPIRLLRRGSVEEPGELVGPGALSLFKGLEHHFALKDPEDEGSRRAALAKWIVDRENPLTWRSIVNRVWQYHFGRGIVDTPNDFGSMGSKPAHPELLDWLAAWFRDRGGSLKELHRLLLASAVYRQSSAHRAEAAAADTGNLLLWRMNRSRLEAEPLRDAVLCVSGKLDLTMGGPSVQQFFFKDDHSPVYDYRRFDIDSAPSYRRSIYRFIVRSVPDPFMESLDCPDASLLMPQRYTTLTAQQALALLNNPFMTRQAEHFAERLAESAQDVIAQVDLAYRLALARPPSPEESSLMLDYIQEHGLANFCRLVFNLNEFIFVD